MKLAEITRLLAENKKLKEDKTVLNAKIDAYELYGDQHEEEYSQAFNKGAETAWELARKITCQPINGGFNRSEFEEIFNEGYISDVFEKYTYPEVAAKVAKWEKEKEEIKVGDEVEKNDLRADRQGGVMTVEELKIRVEQLEHDNEQLKNRCWAITKGIMCQFCGFKEDCLQSKPKNDEPKRKVRDRSNIYNQDR